MPNVDKFEANYLTERIITLLGVIYSSDYYRQHGFKLEDINRESKKIDGVPKQGTKISRLKNLCETGFLDKRKRTYYFTLKWEETWDKKRKNAKEIAIEYEKIKNELSPLKLKEKIKIKTRWENSRFVSDEVLIEYAKKASKLATIAGGKQPTWFHLVDMSRKMCEEYGKGNIDTNRWNASWYYSLAAMTKISTKDEGWVDVWNGIADGNLNIAPNDTRAGSTALLWSIIWTSIWITLSDSSLRTEEAIGVTCKRVVTDLFRILSTLPPEDPFTNKTMFEEYRDISRRIILLRYPLRGYWDKIWSICWDATWDEVKDGNPAAIWRMAWCAAWSVATYITLQEIR